MSAQKITFSYITIVVLVAVVLLMTSTRGKSISIDPTDIAVPVTLEPDQTALPATLVATAQPDIQEEGFFYSLTLGGRVHYYNDFHDRCTVVFVSVMPDNLVAVNCRGMLPAKVSLPIGKIFYETVYAPRMTGLYWGAVTVRSETKLLRHVMYLPQLANER